MCDDRMMSVTLREMTDDEYGRWQQAIAEDYAAQQVAAGRWAAEGALERAHAENTELLPQGLDTPRMLILQAVDEADAPLGRAWIALDHPRGTPDCAFLYDIEIDEPHRGRGFGRQLLAAVERAAREAGANRLELNVFGGNERAIGLYASSGYDLVTQQMRKQLDSD